MEEQVLNTIKKYNLIRLDDKVVCGVSGGPDSICMLDTLRKIKETGKLDFEIIVAHVNHQIREEADLDEEYVINYCKKNDIKCYVKRIDVKEYANNKKQGTEEAGRTVRYEFFNAILKRENANTIPNTATIINIQFIFFIICLTSKLLFVILIHIIFFI